MAKASPSNGIQDPSHYKDSFSAHTNLTGAMCLGAGTKASEDKQTLLAILSDAGEWRKYPIAGPRQLTSV